MPPAIEGMEEAHCLFFVVGRTCFHNRADKNFNQTAANGVNNNRNQDSSISIWEGVRKHDEKNQTKRRAEVRKDNRDAVTEPVNKKSGKHINGKLNNEINRYQQGDF